MNLVRLIAWNSGPKQLGRPVHINPRYVAAIGPAGGEATGNSVIRMVPGKDFDGSCFVVVGHTDMIASQLFIPDGETQLPPNGTTE